MRLPAWQPSVKGGGRIFLPSGQNKALDLRVPFWQPYAMINPLRQYLEAAGETAAAFSERLPISSSYLSRLMSGEREADASLMAAIQKATANKVTPDQWVSWWVSQGEITDRDGCASRREIS